MRKQNYSSEEINKLKEFYPLEGALFCANLLNRPIGSIRAKVSELKLKVNIKIKSRNMSASKANRRLNPLIYKINPNDFINCISGAHAYLLGLIWADGHINKYNVIISSTYPDADVFYRIALKTGKWNVYNFKHKNENWKEGGIISTGNYILSLYLKENGYYARSSESACKILSKIPENLKHYWFRGLFDGDGTLYIKRGHTYRLSISSNYNQNWTYLGNLCQSLEIKYYVSRFISKKTGHSNSAFNISNKKGCLKFLIYIYQSYGDDDMGLQRKYNKYLQLLEVPNRPKCRGVSFLRDEKKWRAYYYVNRKYVHLGIYETENEALIAVDNFIKKNNIKI